MSDWLYRRVLRWMQELCEHPSDDILFDVREESIERTTAISWCRTCGAIRVGRQEFRRLRPDWGGKP
jgi:hypothetical protein